MTILIVLQLALAFAIGRYMDKHIELFRVKTFIIVGLFVLYRSIN